MLISSLVSAQDNFTIVEPFPENIYPVEFSSTQVTCVAFDSTGIKIPDRIEFVRISQYGDCTTLKESNNLYLTNRTELVDQGWKPTYNITFNTNVMPLLLMMMEARIY